MTEAELVQIEQREAAAKPGPWHVDEMGGMLTSADGDYVHSDWAGCHPSDEDTAFIIGARQDVPALLAEVRRLRELLQQAEWEVEDASCPWCHGTERAYDSARRLNVDAGHAPTCPAFPLDR